jgi:hypothetical protein
LINNALGLPFEEPQETYSTSAHLYHDLGIDPNAKGRIAPAKPARGREEPDEQRARRSERARTRNRRRLRNGVPVDRDHGEPGPATSAETSVPAEVGLADAGEPGAEPARRRRRHRGPRPDRAPHLQVDQRPAE